VRKLWIPDASMVCAALTLAYCLFAPDGWRNFFRDSDTGWHIRTGERILATRSLPSTDPYSFTRAGAPWFAWEWGADAATALAEHNGAGLAGVAVLYAAAIAFATWLWWRLTWVMQGDFLLAWLLAILMVLTTSNDWLARPRIFGWLFAIGAVWLAERAPEKSNWRSFIAVALMAIVWTNVDASFFLLPVILLIYAAADFIGPRVFTSVSTPPRWRWFLTAAAVSLLATFVNPYGWRIHQHVFEYLSNSEFTARIGSGSAAILLTAGVAALGGVLALVQGSVARFMLVLLFLPIGLLSANGMPLVALLLLPVANGAITQALREANGLRKPVARRIRAILYYSSRLRGFDRRFSGWALMALLFVLVIVIARRPAIQARAGFPPTEFPVAAAEQIAWLPIDARILAPDTFGGYLIYRFDGKRQVFLDGRRDFYGAAFMKNYLDLIEVRPNWQDVLAKFDFTHALLPNRYSLIPALEQGGWRVIYRDDVATLLAR
jgi:hypothetical protein